MKLIYSLHWTLKKRKRNDISDEFIEFAITESETIKDRYWSDVYNAITRIPETGRRLKVVYRIKGKNIYKIISAYWLE